MSDSHVDGGDDGMRLYSGSLRMDLLTQECEDVMATVPRLRDQLNTKWLNQFLNAGFSVDEGSARRRLVSLVYSTGLIELVEMVDGWDAHHEWRRALPPT